jgi:quinolinate synthase
MAETAKVLNPSRVVVVPDREAGCSLVDSCPVEQLRAFKRSNPDHVIVSYINTSVEVKAESDILCTSRNAVDVVNSIPADKPILFLPDINLGNYVKKQTGRENMKIWQGACIVHATFPARRLSAARAEHPEALVAAHPECPQDVLNMADFIGSTSAIIDWCTKQSGDEFIVMTESGVSHSLHRLAPNKKFYFVANENCNCSECPYMRKNTLEKLLACLETLEPRVELSPEIMQRALVPIDRMLAIR